MIVSLIAALADDNRAIGWQGQLPWRLPDDLARFRQLTMGHSLLMGSRTFESLGDRRLDGRRIILVSRHRRLPPAGADALAASIEDALLIAERVFQDDGPFIAGGGQVYEQALADDLVDRMYLTWVMADVPGDVFFPPFDPTDWDVVASQPHPADERHQFAFRFEQLERRRP